MVRNNCCFFVVKVRLKPHMKLNLAEDKKILNDMFEEKPVNCIYQSILKKRGTEKVDLSIIVPMYNSEEFVDKLIQSLIGQKTIFKYEIILVDDGSVDATGDKIKKYLRDRNIIYIRKDNGGLSSARNAGLDVARGKYVGFVDSDDYIDEYYVDKLLKAAYRNDADIVKCGTANVKDGKIVSKDCHCNETIIGKMGEKILEYPSYAWAGVFRSELLEEVRFPLSYWYEDMIVRFLLYRQSSKFVNIEEPLYFRVSHVGQLTKMKLASDDYRCLDHIYLIEGLVRENRNNKLGEDVYLYMNVLHECSSIMVNRLNKLDNMIRQQAFLRARELLNGLWKEEYASYLKGEWKVKNDVMMKGRYDLWLLEKYL